MKNERKGIGDEGKMSSGIEVIVSEEGKMRNRLKIERNETS